MSEDASASAPVDAPLPPVIPQRAKPRAVAALVRFGVIGLIGVGVNLAVLQLTYGVLGWGFTRSSAIATETAILSNYVGNELWTFHLRRLDWGRLLRFNAVALVALVITVTVATILKEFLDYRLAQLIGIGLGSSVNFAVNFLWTWR